MKRINAINNVNTGPNIVGFVVVRNGCCVGNQSSIVLTQWDIFPYTYTPYFIFCVRNIAKGHRLLAVLAAVPFESEARFGSVLLSIALTSAGDNIHNNVNYPQSCTL